MRGGTPVGNAAPSEAARPRWGARDRIRESPARPGVLALHSQYTFVAERRAHA